VEGLNSLVSKEAPSWLGPTGQENFSSLNFLDSVQILDISLQRFCKKGYYIKEHLFYEVERCKIFR